MKPHIPQTCHRDNVRSSAGFTLIEVMVVTIIIGIIVSSVLFSFDITGSQKTRTAVSNVQLLMRGLATEAILEGDRYGLRYDYDEQRLTPIIESGNGWSAYSSEGGTRPVFKPVSWKGVAEVEIITSILTIDERRKDLPNFYSGLEEEERKQARQAPLINFSPTGLWEPAGEIHFFIAGRPYATIKWTAAGRISFEHGDAS